MGASAAPGEEARPSAQARLQEIAQKTGALLSLHIEVTSRCSLRCQHCYNDRAVPATLDSKTLARVLEETAGLGSLFLLLTGGEVYLHPEFAWVVAQARALGFAVVVKTSGWLVGEKEAAFLAAQAVSEVHVSLYAARPEIHDRMTGVPGSYERVLRAIQALRRHGVRVGVRSLVTSLNAAHFRDIVRLAEELGCEYSVDATVSPCEDGSLGPCALRPPDATLREFYGEYAWPQLEKGYRERKPLGTRRPLDDTPCLAGATSLFVASDGTVYPCVDLKVPCGNVHTESLTKIWRASEGLRRVRSITWRDLPVCARCDLRTTVRTAWPSR